ncbi:MAG TPA: FGGY family carbohydrate kinase [Solirubrobacteraceae bacterium]|nr:FGGY family carbohydrate kinase [Solirubrobacteraceae bacterium]
MDVGSQGTCAQALEPDGTLIASSYAPHDLQYPRPGWAEQDPGEWLRALVQTLAELRLATRRPVRAISFGSQLDGLVATDGHGRALRPALIWSDRRADAECERVAADCDVVRLRERTGCNLDPGHVASKIAWLRVHEPEVDRQAVRYLLPGSWVAYQATGEVAVDPTNASSTGLLDSRRLQWSDEACAAFAIDPERLGPVRPSDAVLGRLAPWLRDATGLPGDTEVVLGAGDEMAAVLGAGVTEPGEVCDVMGTAEPVCAVLGAPALDAAPLVELHPHAVPDRWLLENPGWLSGGAYRWFRDELGGPEVARAAATGADVYELLNALAMGAPPGAAGVCWVPALSGAMAPEWNSRARAGWFGLTAAHGRAHMARALLEGNALALRDVVEAIAAGGHRLTGLVCVGGGARGELLLSIRANATGLTVCRPQDVETTARGAAMLAAAGSGIHATVAAAAKTMAGPRVEPVQPDPELRAVYDAVHARHLQVYAALRPLYE